MTKRADRAVIYCRVSSDKEGKGKNVEDQEADCRDLCELEGWKVADADVFVDEKKSAADPTKERPAYNRMMKALAKGGFDVVVVTMADRLHRQPAEVDEFVNAFLATGMTKVTTVRSGDFDISRPNGLYNFRQEGNVAEREIGILKVRVRRRKLRNAQDGAHGGGGRRPYGWGKNPDDDTPEAKLAALKLINEVNEVEAAHIRDAADRVLKLETLYSIREDWTKCGVATVTGRPWSITAIKGILIAPRVAGLREHKGEVIGDAVWPRILDKTTWESVTALLTDPSRKQPKASRSYPLRGVLRCAECDAYLISMPAKGRRYYGCKVDQGGCGKVSISADRVEEYVFGELLPMAK